jgi:hypothetical protein
MKRVAPRLTASERPRIQFTNGGPGVYSDADKKGDRMSRLIRLDRTGHTELATWSAGDDASEEAAIETFRRELDEGMLASATLPDGSAEVVRELPLNADLVVMRRHIAGG